MPHCYCFRTRYKEASRKPMQEYEWNSSAGVYGDNLLCKNIIINRQLQNIYEMPVQMLAYNSKHVGVVSSQCRTRSKNEASQPIL